MEAQIQEAAAIAAKLSPTMRRAVLAYHRDRIPVAREQFTRHTFRALESRGLLPASRTFDEMGWRGLTELGLAVASHLEHTE